MLLREGYGLAPRASIKFRNIFKYDRLYAIILLRKKFGRAARKNLLKIPCSNPLCFASSIKAA